MNRVRKKFTEGKKVLTTFITAGYPEKDSLSRLVREMEEAGVGMVEIGIPYSDPLADGPTIQMSSEVALKNGMNLRLILMQVEEIRKTSEIPLLLMGYLNPVLQYGVVEFLEDAAAVGVDGLILPDLPPELYEAEYKELFERYGMATVFIVSPETSDERAAYIDRLTTGFVYIVSSSSTTGRSEGFTKEQKQYFELQSKRFKNPIQIGFGISTSTDVRAAHEFADGAIVGSHIIRSISNNISVYRAVHELLT